MQENRSFQSIKILSVPVSVLESYRQTVDTIVERVRSGQKTFCIAINPEKIYCAQKDSKLKELINKGNLHICDGVGTAIAAKILHGRRPARITGVQLFLELMAKAEKEGLKVFLLGASEESNKGAFEKLTEKHPELRIVGRENGYFENSETVVEKINQSGADMVFVAMGSPKQEYWIAENIDKLVANFVMGVGGSFDVVSGRAKWAPKIFRRTGTEFLYRLITNPKRWRRQLVLPKFAIMVLTKKLVHPHSNN